MPIAKRFLDAEHLLYGDADARGFLALENYTLKLFAVITRARLLVKASLFAA